MKSNILKISFFIFMLISCNNINNVQILGDDSTLTGKYKTEYVIYYTSNNKVHYEIYSDKEIYVCSFQGTNFLLEKDNTEEIMSTTAPIRIIKSEIVK